MKLFEESNEFSAAILYLKETQKQFDDLKNSLISKMTTCEEEVFNTCANYINSTTFRLLLQANNQSDFDKWKKEVEAKMKDKQLIIMTFVECLKSNELSSGNFLKHGDAKHGWKRQLISYIFEVIHPILKKLIDGLINKKAFIDKEKIYHESKNEITSNQNSEKLKELVDIRNTLLTNQEVNELSNFFPIDYHVLLLKKSFECQEYKIFKQLIDLSRKRIELFCYEIPYISDVMFIESSEKQVDIPSGYELINIDLNEPHLLAEIKRIRSFDDKKDNKVPKKEFLTTTGVKYTDIDLGKTNYRYVYLAFCKTHEVNEAIVDIKIQFESEEISEVEQIQGYTCMRIPIEQYTGVQSTYKTVPYLYFKKNTKTTNEENIENSLIIGKTTNTKQINQETTTQSLKNVLKSTLSKPISASYISDIKPLLKNWVYVRPDFGYERINVDLRQVPQEFINLPNMFYTYITVKRQKNIEMCKAITEILENLYELEDSVENSKVKNDLELRDIIWRKFGINVDFRLYEKISYNLKMCVEFLKEDPNLGKGPMNFLSDISISIWESFFSPLMVQLFHTKYLDFINKLDEFYSKEIKIMTDELYGGLFISSLETILEIMNLISIDLDLLFYIKASFLLGSILETVGNEKKASCVYFSALEKIKKYRQTKHTKKLRGIEETPLYLDISCNPAKINSCWDKMVESFKNWQIQSEETIFLSNGIDESVKQQAKNIVNPLSQKTDELFDLLSKEKRQEIKNCKRHFFPELEEKNIKFIEEIKRTQISSYDSLLNSLQQEIFISYCRTKIALGNAQTLNVNDKRFSTLNKNNQTLLEKIKNNILKEQKVQEKLKTALNNANNLPLENAKLEEAEKSLICEIKSNCYERAIAFATIASTRVSSDERKRFLETSLNEIKNAINYESERLEDCVKNASYIFSYSEVDILSEKYISTEYPLKLLYESTFVKNLKFPPTPILLKINQTSAILRIPRFQLKQMPDNQNMSENSHIRYEYDVVVRKEENSLSQEETKSEQGDPDVYYDITTKSLVTITNLQPNNKYSFSVVCRDNDNKKIIKSQKPLTNIVATLPLFLPSILFYTAKVAYYFGFYTMVKSAILEGLKNILLQKNEYESYLNYNENPLTKYYFNMTDIKNLSLIDLQNVAEAVLIFCRTQIFELELKIKTEKKTLLIKKQAFILEIIGLVLLSAELSASISSYALAANAIQFAFLLFTPFLKKKLIPAFFFTSFVKMYCVCQMIPMSFWGDSINNLSSKLLYQIARICLFNDEFFFFKRILCQDILIGRRMLEILPSNKESNFLNENEQVEKKTNVKNQKMDEKPNSSNQGNLIGKKTNTIDDQTGDQNKNGAFFITEAENHQNEIEMFLENIDPKLMSFIKMYHEKHRAELENLPDSSERTRMLETDAQFVEMISLMSDPAKGLASIVSQDIKVEKQLEFINFFLEKCILLNLITNEVFLLLEKVEKQMLKYLAMKTSNEKGTWEKILKVLSLKFKAYKFDIEWNNSKCNVNLKIKNQEMENNKVSSNQTQDVPVKKQEEVISNIQKVPVKTVVLNENQQIKENTEMAKLESSKLFQEALIFEDFKEFLGENYSEKYMFGNFNDKEVQRILRLIAKLFSLQAKFNFIYKEKSLLQSIIPGKIRLFEADMTTIDWHYDFDITNYLNLKKEKAKNESVSDPNITSEVISMKEMPLKLQNPIEKQEIIEIEVILEQIMKSIITSLISKCYALFHNTITFYFNFLKILRISSDHFTISEKAQSCVCVITDCCILFLEELKKEEITQLLNLEESDKSKKQQFGESVNQQEKMQETNNLSPIVVQDQNGEVLKKASQNEINTDLNEESNNKAKTINECKLNMIKSKIDVFKNKQKLPNVNSVNEENAQEVVEHFLEIAIRGKQWWQQIRGFDFSMICNIFAFSIHVLFKCEKGNILKGFCKRFSELTENQFTLKIMPFIIETYAKFHFQAEQERNEATFKSKELQKDLANLMLNTELESDNQSALNQAKIQEVQNVINFQKRELEIIKERLLIFKNEKQLAFNNYNHYRRQSNDALEKLNIVCKSIYWMKTQIELNNHATNILQSDIHQGNKKLIIYQLKNDIIDDLKKKYEYQILVRAFYTLARFCLEMNEIEDAKKIYRELIDTTFQNLHVLENVKSTKKDFLSEMAHSKFDSKSLHFCLIALYDLCHFVESDNLSVQESCVELANSIVSFLFNKNLPYPIGTTSQKAIEIQDFEYQFVFENEQEFPAESFIRALEYFSEFNLIIDYKQESLSMVNYFYYMVSKVMPNILLAGKAMSIKIRELARSGMISEAIFYFKKSVDFGFMNSMCHFNGTFENTIGFIYFQKDTDNQLVFYNDLTFFDERNQKAIEQFLNIIIKPSVEKGPFGVKIASKNMNLFVSKNENVPSNNYSDLKAHKLSIISKNIAQIEANVDAVIDSGSNGLIHNNLQQAPDSSQSLCSWFTLAKHEIIYAILKFENFDKIEFLKIREGYLKASIKLLENTCSIILLTIQAFYLSDLRSNKTITMKNFESIFKGLFFKTELPIQNDAKLDDFSEIGVNRQASLQELLKLLFYNKFLIQEHYERLNLASGAFEKAKELLSFFSDFSSGSLKIDQLVGLLEDLSKPQGKKAPQAFSPADLKNCEEFAKELKTNKELISIYVKSTIELSPLPVYFWLKIKTNIATALFAQNRFNLLDDFVNKLLPECAKLRENFFRKKLIAIKGKLEFKTDFPEKSMTTFQDLLEDSQEGKEEDDIEEVEPFCDLAELELLSCHFGHSLMYFLHAKKIMTKSSSFLTFMAQNFGSLSFLQDENLHLLYEMMNIHSGKCQLIKKNEMNKNILSHIVEIKSETRRISKVMKNVSLIKTQMIKKEQDFENEKLSNSTNTDNLIFLDEQNQTLGGNELLNTNAKIFAELQENPNEIKQIIKSVFNRESLKTNEKDANQKGDKKKEKNQQNSLLFKKFFDYENQDLKNEKKLTPILLKELPQNKKSECPSIYDSTLETFIKINFRILYILLNMIGENNEMFLNKRKAVFKMLDFCQKICAELNVFFVKNYYIQNSIKAEYEYYLGKILKTKAKGIFLQTLEDLIKENECLANTDFILGKIHRFEIVNFPKVEFVPGYTKLVSDKFIPLLEKAKEKFTNCLIYLKFESVFTEFLFDLKDVFYEISEVNIWILEHKLDFSLKFLKEEDVM